LDHKVEGAYICGTGQFGGMTQGTHGCLVVGNGVGLLVAIVP